MLPKTIVIGCRAEGTMDKKERCGHDRTIHGEKEIDSVDQGLLTITMPFSIVIYLTVCADCGKVVDSKIDDSNTMYPIKA